MKDVEDSDLDDENEEGGEPELHIFKLVDPPSERVDSLGNIDYIFEGGMKKKTAVEIDSELDDSSEGGPEYEKAKKLVKAMESVEDSNELKDDVRSLPGEKKKTKKKV